MFFPEGQKKRLAEELDSLRRQIAELRDLLQEPPPAEPPARPAAVPGSALPPLFEAGPFGMLLLDAGYRVVDANEALCRLLGYEKTGLQALDLPSLLHSEDAPRCIQLVDEVVSSARSWGRTEGRILKRSGEAVRAQCTLTAFGPETARRCVAVIEDVTRLRETEQSAENRHRVYEQLFEISPDGVFAFNRECLYTLWNPAMEKMFGLKKEEALGRSAFEVLPFLSETEGCLETLEGKSFTLSERPFKVPGREGFFDCRYSPLYDREGGITGGLGIVRDATPRKQAEEAARVAVERYRELFENASDIVFTHDLDGKLTSVNKAAERITGYTREEALARKASSFAAPEFRDLACRMVERRLAGESPGPYEIDIITRDGRRVALEINTWILYREGKAAAVQGIARDVTGRKKTEEALQQAKEKLESWVQELEQRTREMTLLSEMGDLLRACFTTDEAYNVIVRTAQQVFPVETGALYVITPSRNAVEAVAAWGDSARIERVFAPDECWALRRGRVHWVEDTETGLLCRHLPHPPPEGYLCVPMMAQSEALGILYLTQPEGGRLTEAKQRLAVAMAEQIAMALSNLKLHETLRSQSIRDPLTGLFNRRFMEESLELELRRAARSRRPLSLIVLEIDDFPEVAEKLGRDVEEAVLQEIGNLLQTIVRKADIASRMGGGKFAIILPQSSAEVTAQRAESLVEAIRSSEPAYRGRPVGRFTASMGVAIFPDQGLTGEALTRVAEAALERAQAEGGDRVVIAK